MVNFKDLMDAAGGSFEPLPKGPVDAVVTAAEATKTSNGKTMYKMTWSVLTGPNANRKVWGNQVISPESPPALGIFFRQMAALGLGADYFSGNPSEEQVARDLVGRQATLMLDQKEYQGTLRNEIKDIRKLAGVLPGGAPVPQVNPGGIPAPTSDPAQVPGTPKIPF